MRLLAVLVALLALPSSIALACHNGVEAEINPIVSILRRSERALTSGHLRRAFRTAQRAHRRADAPSDSALRTRAERVMAVATVRLSGDVDRASTRRTPHPQRLRENTQWATLTLRRHYASRPGDVVVAARLAEALTLDASTQREAYDLILPLRHVLPDTFAFRTLAILIDRFGEARDRDRLLSECLRRVHGPGRGVCRPVS